MWKRAVFTIAGSAYLGGLVGVLALDPFGGVPDTSGLLLGSLELMIFTLPGVLMVSGIFAYLEEFGCSRPIAYFLSVLFGSVMGGAILTAIIPDVSFMRVGALFGFITTCCWSALNQIFVVRAATPTALTSVDN